MLPDTPQTETNLSLWKYFTDDAAKIKDRMDDGFLDIYAVGRVAGIYWQVYKRKKRHTSIMRNRVMVIANCIVAICTNTFGTCNQKKNITLL